jgi:hypothetical protein
MNKRNKRCKKKSVPVNKKLYNRLKNKIKARSKVWPSAYASGQLVRAYKTKGGTYKCARKNAFSFYRCSSFGSLDRWFKEKWVDVCRPKRNGKYRSCGRSKSSRKGYPYCRPSVRVNAQTPKTVREIGKSNLKKRCSKKRKNPYRRIFGFGTEKNNGEGYKAGMEKNQTCGFGRRRQRFGDNLGPTNSNLDTFYKNGTANSLNMDPGSCLGKYYGEGIQDKAALQRFGKKRFIKEAFKSFERKGTKGSFTRWCKTHGYPKVTTACINRAKKSSSLKIRRKAIFAQNIKATRGAAPLRSIRSKKRVYSFGKINKKKTTLSKVNNDIKYLSGL